MICGFCGREIPDEIDQERTSCGACSGGCRKVHCPHCGYGNPLVSPLLRRWKKKSGPKEDEC